MNKDDILKLIQEDFWMVKVIKTVSTLNLPDWWIGAGFVRGKVWDTLHVYQERTPLSDIDVIYFDKNDFTSDEANNQSTTKEKEYEKKLNRLIPNTNWSVTNQARMHIFHNTKEYNDSTDALSDWVETATCIGVKIDQNNNFTLTAPHGIDDLVNLILRPTTKTAKNIEEFNNRVTKKKWLIKWPKLKIKY